MHIEALVLAFAHSSARSLVGTDALRTVISGQYRDMITDDGFELETLWTLLESQPGFDPRKAKPPLCRFKTWESDLELPVVLPKDFGELESHDIHAIADECRVPSAELDKVLERGKYTKEAREERQAKWAGDPEQAEVTEVEEHRNAKPLLLIAVTVVALISLGVAGYFLYTSISTKGWDDVSTSLGTEIPNAKAERLGIDLNMTLRDDAWLASPEATRRQSLEDLMTRLGRDGVENIIVRDKNGKIRGTAQRVGASVRVRVL